MRHVAVLAALAFGLPWMSASASPQQPPRPESLPASVQALGRALLAESSPEVRADLADEISERAPVGSLDFLLALLDRETSPDVRLAIVNGIGHVSDARVRERLGRLVTGTAEPRLATFARARLRDRLMEDRLRPSSDGVGRRAW